MVVVSLALMFPWKDEMKINEKKIIKGSTVRYFGLMSISTNKIFRAENWHQTLQIRDILISRQPQEIHAPWQQAATCTPELRLETGQCIILSVKYSWLNSKFPLYLHFFLNRIVAGYEIYCRLQPGHFITLRCALRHAAVASQHKAGYLATCGGDNI